MVAALHADSWRRHYRGAYSDSFLDGDVLADRLAEWSARLREPDPLRVTILAEDGGPAEGGGPAEDGGLAEGGGLAGFANTYLDHDAEWGALLDNLHVAAARKRGGIGASLMALTARAVRQHAPHGGIYLWVLEQNTNAQAFYEACGGRPAGSEAVSPPGGVPGRLNGAPVKLRYAWPHADVLLAACEARARGS